MKETDLFAATKQWLEEKGWDVYAEVTGVGGRADVVGNQGKVMLNIELKLQLSFELLSQALDRKSYFHYVYVAIPKRKTPIPNIVRDILQREGIGLLEISDGYASLILPARFNRPPCFHLVNWENTLRPEYKSQVGGDNGSHILTPYKILMIEVRNYLVGVRDADNSRAIHGGFRNYGWVSIDDILNHCEAHRHYASPKPSLANALRSYELDWCETKKENRKTFYRAKEGTKRVPRHL